jgi:ABC-type enterochelin transport system ATPase subunit
MSTGRYLNLLERWKLSILQQLNTQEESLVVQDVVLFGRTPYV